MTEQEKYEFEKKELNILIEKGLTFSVTRNLHKRTGLGLTRKRVEEKLTFTIQEPTLSTLDRLAEEQIELRIDESLLSSSTGTSEARKLAKQHVKRCAKIVALAVLGQDYVTAKTSGSHTRYSYDKKRLKELTEIFYHNIKPSKLMYLVTMLNAISNLGDFCNSIRSMSASRTTMPDRIENNED